MAGQLSGLAGRLDPLGVLITADKPAASRAALICPVVMPPGRSNCTVGPVQSMIVDSTPLSHGPPSRTRSMRPSSDCMTCSLRVGLILPEGLALGAATGALNSCKSRLASGCAGTLMATLSKPALVNMAIRAIFGAIKDKSHRPGPECCGKCSCAWGWCAECKSRLCCRNMADQRIELRPVFRGKYSGYGLCIAGISAKAIDCFSQNETSPPAASVSAASEKESSLIGKSLVIASRLKTGMSFNWQVIGGLCRQCNLFDPRFAAETHVFMAINRDMAQRFRAFHSIRLWILSPEWRIICRACPKRFRPYQSIADNRKFAMCGRFTSTASPEELMRHFGVSILENLRPRWNVAPSQKCM